MSFSPFNFQLLTTPVFCLYEVNRFVIACEEYSLKDVAAELKELKAFFFFKALKNTKKEVYHWHCIWSKI